MLLATTARLFKTLSIACVAIAVCLPDAARADLCYFVSMTTGGLYRYDTANLGAGITTLSAASTFNSPSALALGPDGNLYVGDMDGGGRIARYAVADGSVTTVVSLSGAGPTFSSSPLGPGAIAFRPSGQGGQMLVGRNPFTAFYSYPLGPVIEVSGWGVGGSPTVQDYTTGVSLADSPGVVVAADGSLYVSNSLYDTSTFLMTGNVLKFNSSGAYQGEVTADGSGSGGPFGPAGLALVGTSLYVASTMNGNIYKTDLTNANTSTNTSLFGSTGGDYIGPLAALSDGSLLVGSVSGPAGLIYQFDAAGSLTGYMGGASYGQIGGIVAVPVPEPATAVLAMAAVAICSAAVIRRRRA